MTTTSLTVEGGAANWLLGWSAGVLTLGEQMVQLPSLLMTMMDTRKLAWLWPLLLLLLLLKMPAVYPDSELSILPPFLTTPID